MKKVLAIIFSVIVFCVGISYAADLGLSSSLKMRYYLWAQRFEVSNYDSSVSSTQQNNPQYVVSKEDRLTTYMNPVLLTVEKAEILYWTGRESEIEMENCMKRIYAFIGAIEYDDPPFRMTDDSITSILSAALSMTKVMGTNESDILNGDEVVFYKGKRATFYVSMTDDGIIVTAK